MNATSIKKDEINTDLWAGQGNEQQTGDDSGNVIKQVLTGSFNTGRKREINFVPVTATTPAVSTPATTPVFTPAADIDFGAIIANNKWLIIGAIGVIGYLIYSSSLAADDRTVTSVTRYSARKKK